MPRPAPTPPSALADRAADQLAFIRDTMVRAGRFTAVSGAGMILSGVIGTAAALLTPMANGPEQRLALWLVAAAITIPSSLVAVARKAARSGQSLRAGPARTFALAFAPALAVGALLTLALVRSAEWNLLPGAWLCCYGAAVVSGGAFSVRAVPVLGTVLVTLGALALFLPAATHVWLLGLGFGLTHLAFGFFIARYHGG
ncbi:MAG: hypothetical protein ACYC3L_04670 [Gemmatimonadaceae bacterium]